ncbi:hypothetical protein VZ95_08115 [Elstera litoralis]|jgi:hypothetical protein|uniref:Uncharacterized protein n=1 Tax=Elstera litoralis TaxID=552518 RepID=A0A0F3IWH8_9PROT|nr:hypothetical protein [Elstera litoralis]KJV09964.1 hypothetical protein VZ95_08115 [Elstera litoralis]
MIVPPINPVVAALAGAAQAKPQPVLPPTSAQTQRAMKPAPKGEETRMRDKRDRDEERDVDLDQQHRHSLDLSV